MRLAGRASGRKLLRGQGRRLQDEDEAPVDVDSYCVPLPAQPCPYNTPFRCDGAGSGCVEDEDMCAEPYTQTCAPSEPVQGFDGSCAATAAGCQDSDADCDGTFCTDGSCMPDGTWCPVVAACGTGMFRCDDGSCCYACCCPR